MLFNYLRYSNVLKNAIVLVVLSKCFTNCYWFAECVNTLIDSLGLISHISQLYRY